MTLEYEVRRQIRELRRQGLSYLAIARQLKLTKGQVAGIIWRSGMAKKKEEPRLRLVK